MPAIQRGQAYRLGPNRWGLRYYDVNGVRRRKSPFPSKSAALVHYRGVIEPQLRGEPAHLPEVTLAEVVPLYLERHSASVRPKTIEVLRERLGYAVRAFGDVPLRDLERMSGEIAAWRIRLPQRSRYGITQALRQTLGAAVRWDYMSRNPAKQAGRNPQPPPRSIRTYTTLELDAIGVELPPVYRTVPAFAAATGLRPEEWQALERGDIDSERGTITVRQTVSSGTIVELAKTSKSRRQVPLTDRALAVLDALPPRLDTPLIFPAPAGGVMNLDNFRRRMWVPAIEAAGITKPARIYDLRLTFASRALAAGVSVFELARVMGTSVLMIERAYGTLLDGAGAGIASRLNAYDSDERHGSHRTAGTFGP